MGSGDRMGLVLVLIGIAANNYAYLHDLVYKHEDRIWMGPLSYSAAALGIVIILAGAWRLARHSR